MNRVTTNTDPTPDVPPVTKRPTRNKPPDRADERAKPPEEARAPRDWQWWLVASAIPLILCARKLDLDFWYDEAYTLEVFVSRPLVEIATDYSAPNNHVLYSLLLRPVYLLSDSEYVLRLPSLLLAAGTLAMVFRLGRRWGGLVAGVLGAASLGLTQMYLVHAMQVRGYGLSMFLAAWLGCVAAGRSASPWWPRTATIALAGAAFLYVMPSNLLFFAPLAVAALAWTAIRDRGPRPVLREAAAWGLACLLAGLLYLPIFDQVRRAGAGGVGASALDVLALTGRVYRAAFRDWLPIVPLVALGLVFWAREVRRPARRYVVLPLVTGVMLAGPFCVMGLLGVTPFVRNFCPLLPFLGVAFGWLLAELLAALGRLVPAVRSEPAAALVGMVLLAAAAVPRIATYPARLTEERARRFAQDGYYNYYAANFHPSEVARYLQASIEPGENYLIAYADADHFPLALYLRRAGVPPQRIDRSGGGEPPVVYLIAPPVADYAAISAKCGIPVDVLRGLPLVKDFGYFRLYRSGPTATGSPRN